MAEYVLGAVDSLLQDGQMQVFELEGQQVLLSRVDGEYHATANECTHYGGPLNEGVLCGHTVMCPWHHACFDMRDGTRLEPPALNDIARYPVRVEHGAVKVTLPRNNVASPVGKADTAAEQIFVIVGGGAAGNAAAEMLRRRGFGGRIVLLSAARFLPVDRPNVSKDYLRGDAQPDWMPLRSEDWYAERKIDVRLDTPVTRIDPATQTVYLAEGGPLRYDKLLLATGGVARRLRDLPGVDLHGIYTLRSLADADAIIEAVENGKRVVIVGASFIGMEVAASLAKGRGAEVHVVAPEKVPFSHSLGGEVGRLLQREHEAHGVQFHLEDGVTGFTGENQSVNGVNLKSGATLPADCVILGIGVSPATSFLRDSGLLLDEKDGSVRVDQYLESSHPGIFAAGDIARWGEGAGTRIEHWRVAEQHGMIAAQNMLGGQQDVGDTVPFFWTSQWDVTLRYVGHATRWDDLIVRGSIENGPFAAFYVLGGALQAAVGRSADQDMAAIEFILQRRLPLTVEQMRDPAFSLADYARNGTK